VGGLSSCKTETRIEWWICLGQRPKLGVNNCGTLGVSENSCGTGSSQAPFYPHSVTKATIVNSWSTSPVSPIAVACDPFFNQAVPIHSQNFVERSTVHPLSQQPFYVDPCLRSGPLGAYSMGFDSSSSKGIPSLQESKITDKFYGRYDPGPQVDNSGVLPLPTM
jgi:hypothetical protein